MNKSGSGSEQTDGGANAVPARAVQRSDAEWRELLSEHDYHICREKGTERAFTGEYNDIKSEGIFVCKCCQAELFDTSTKYDSGSGWPSFYQPRAAENVEAQHDNSHGMQRTEVLCQRCGAHLGHVFEDGPQPTGLRYCINSASLSFQEGK